MFAVITCVVLYVLSVNVEANCPVEGYYWRDYTGEIPTDALPGGRDIHEKPIYIGQIFNLRFLIPAKIYSTESKAYYEYGGKEFEVTDNIKILCTQNPEQFVWIKTNNADIKLLTDKHLVLGGYEPNCITYIGRARARGEILVGKALTDTPNAGLYVTKDGSTIKEDAFEVLTYDPSILKIDTRYTF